MTELLDYMGQLLIDKFYLGMIFAGFAGLITAFSPCSLSGIPLIITYIGGTGAGKGKALLYSLVICLGKSIVFVLLGIFAALVGKLIGATGFKMLWHIMLGLLMVFMAMELWGLTHILSNGSNRLSKVTKKGFLGAFLVGLIGGFFCMPCSTPVLASILAYVSVTNAGLLKGGLLLLSYSIGHCILLVVAGTSFGLVNQLRSSNKYEKATKIIRFIFGCLVFALGIFFILETFFH